MGTDLSPQQVLDLIPQRGSFRFIDEIVEIDDNHILARYRFRPDADFYSGHFPGYPVTPGVILLETMAQAGVVGLGLYLVARSVGIEETKKLLSFFTDASVEFSGEVRPGARVTTRAEKIYFRRKKLRAKAEMLLDDGTVVCSGIISGMGVTR
jgi:3-hydroxyacyl-[acyl-carrier-protein] dehydratase